MLCAGYAPVGRLALDWLLPALAFRHFGGRFCGKSRFHLCYHGVFLRARKSGTRGDETADDDVLFETDEAIHGAGNRRFGELARRVLEGYGGEERGARERDFGDAQEKLFRLRRLPFGFLRALVDALQFEIRDDLSGGYSGVARVRYRDAAEHLLHDDFEMLSRGRNTLQFVNTGNLVDDVFLRGLLPRQEEELLKVGRAVGQEAAFFDRAPLFHQNGSKRVYAVFGFLLRGLRDLASLTERRRSGFRKNGDDGLRSVFDHIGHDAGNARYSGGSFRRTRFEDLFNARETHRDVAACGRNAPRVEGTHGELCPRLAYRLRGDDTDSLAHIDEFACSEIDAVAFLAYAARDLAGHGRTHDDLLDRGGLFDSIRIVRL